MSAAGWGCGQAPWSLGAGLLRPGHLLPGGGCPWREQGAVPRKLPTQMGQRTGAGAGLGHSEGRRAQGAERPLGRFARGERAACAGSIRPSPGRPLPCAPRKGGSKPQMPSTSVPGIFSLLFSGRILRASTVATRARNTGCSSPTGALLRAVVRKGGGEGGAGFPQGICEPIPRMPQPIRVAVNTLPWGVRWETSSQAPPRCTHGP